MYGSLHPGQFIRFVYLQPIGISHPTVAASLKVSTSIFTRLLNGQSNVSPEMALHLPKTLGRSSESWLAMQSNNDLWQARQAINIDAVEELPLSA